MKIDNLSRVMRKPTFCICENKDADQLRGNREAETAKLISTFVLATQIVQSPYFLVQSPYFLDLKFQASSVAVQPGLCRTWSETRTLISS